jgi:hypothetical protein
MTEFDRSLHEQHGRRYRVAFHYDQDHPAPWKDDDGRGIVSEWTTRKKEPGERILHDDHGSYRYFDFAGTVEKAKRESWGVKGGRLDGETAGQYAVRAVEAEYEYLRAWCRDDWHYAGVVVTLLDDENEPTEYTESLWGVETWGDYHTTVINELVENIEHQLLQHQAQHVRVDPEPDVNWQNDAIQFPRLLAEISANIDWTRRQLEDLMEATDLTKEQLMEIFERATTAWDTIKAKTPAQR